MISLSGCQNKADIVLVVDGSYSVTSPNFQKVKDGLKQLAVKLPISQDGVHLGMMQYSGKTSLEFPLTMHPDRSDIPYISTQYIQTPNITG